VVNAIGLVVHTGKAVALAAADAVRDWARTHDILSTDIDVWSVNGSNGRLHAAEEAVRAGKPELIVTVGGDGTFLRGVRVAATIDAMVLGVDVGRVGFLTETSVPDLRSALDAVLGGDFGVDERLMVTMCASRPLEIPEGIEALLRYGRGPALPPPRPREHRSQDPDNGVPLDILALNDIVFEKLAIGRRASPSPSTAGCSPRTRPTRSSCRRPLVRRPTASRRADRCCPHTWTHWCSPLSHRTCPSTAASCSARRSA
jgi:NAD+ kinase